LPALFGHPQEKIYIPYKKIQPCFTTELHPYLNSKFSIFFLAAKVRFISELQNKKRGKILSKTFQFFPNWKELERFPLKKKHLQKYFKLHISPFEMQPFSKHTSPAELLY
jgi:hypothetical protein